MTITETKNSDANMNSKWLRQNLAEMELSVNQLLKLVEEDGKTILEKAEIEMHGRPEELIAHIQEFHRLFKSLAAQFYDHSEYCKPSEFDEILEGAGNSETGSDHGSPLQHNTVHQPASLSSGGGVSSGFSFKEGTESSSLLSSDSESESYVSSVNNNADSELNSKVAAIGNYEELLGKVAKYEEELKVLNHRIHLSGIEMARAKSELENVNTQLESAQQEIKEREAKLELERREVSRLKKQIAELETHASDSNLRIGSLIAELEESRTSLTVSNEEIAVLNADLGSEMRQVSELKEEIAKYKDDLSVRENEANELKVSLSDANTNFSEAKALMQSEISSLSENQALLDARLREWELRGTLLEDKIRQCQVAEAEMKSLHINKESTMQSEINRLKEELANQGKHVEVLNKDFDKLKLKYDMLMAEKDGVKAKVDTLIAELSCRDNRIMQMEEHVEQLHRENVEKFARSESERKVIDELKARVDELEKETDKQRSMIVDGAEEKREAIRQLCFSLDHYRSGYKELREAFLGYKRHALI